MIVGDCKNSSKNSFFCVAFCGGLDVSGIWHSDSHCRNTDDVEDHFDVELVDLVEQESTSLSKPTKRSQGRNLMLVFDMSKGSPIPIMLQILLELPERGETLETKQKWLFAFSCG
jgi:hypothetical protein